VNIVLFYKWNVASLKYKNPDEHFLRWRTYFQGIPKKSNDILPRHISQILGNRRAITADTAIKLSDFFGKPAEYWVNLQNAYDIGLIRQKLEGLFPDDQPFEQSIIHNPHDKLIKIVFSDRQEAVSFFKNNLPKKMIDLIDWDTLRLEGSQYIDETFQSSESDLLYSVCFKDGETECFLYVLFEHQTQPDKWIRFRILKYKTRIWDEYLKISEKPDKLPPILPMVFYIGRSKWSYSSEFIHLVSDNPLDSEYIPKFKHLLLDYSDQDKEIKGAIKAKIAQLLIQASFHKQLQHMISLLSQLIASLPDHPGIDYKKVFIYYIGATQTDVVVSEIFSKVKQHKNNSLGGDMLSAIESWELKGWNKGLNEGLNEGWNKGRIETTLSMVGTMKKSGMDWPLIANATGIDLQKYQQMQHEYQQIQALPDRKHMTCPTDANI
jgi:predicted transposase/invertase (TIGR01784 family)